MKARTLILAAAIALTPLAHATSHDSTTTALTQGEVRKVDKDARKITIKHQEIRNLEMPAMTMVFPVKDESMLDRVKQGDKVQFTAEKVGGTITVTTIDPVK